MGALANCPACGGKTPGGHVQPCRIGAAEGLCATCEGRGRVERVLKAQPGPCPDCHGEGAARPGKPDLAAELLRGMDACTRELCGERTN